MNRTPSLWQVKFVSRFANFLEDLEGTMAFVVEFLSRSVGTYVGCFQPDLITYLILNRSVLLLIIELFDLILGQLERCFGFFLNFGQSFDKFSCSFILRFQTRLNALPRMTSMINKEWSVQ
jgi:hypothetical protein